MLGNQTEPMEASQTSAKHWQMLNLLLVDNLPAPQSQLVRELWQNPDQNSSLTPEISINLESVVAETQSPVPHSEAEHSQVVAIDRMVDIAVWGDQLWLAGVYANLASQQIICQSQLSMEVIALVFNELLRHHGWIPLHAACVAKDGQAVAIIGPSGVGKSSATLRLAQSGYTIVAEDRSFWHPASGCIAGLDSSLRAFEDSLLMFAPQLLDKAKAHNYPKDGKGKYIFPLSEIAAQSSESHYLQQVLVLNPHTSDAATSTFSGLLLAKTAWETSGVPLAHTARQRVQAGIQQLLPLIDRRPCSRQEVLERVGALLG